MNRDQIQRIAGILARHRGSKAEIARSLQINAVNVSQWLRGRGSSKRVEDACVRKAAQLLVEEERAVIAAENRPRDITAREAIDSLRGGGEK